MDIQDDGGHPPRTHSTQSTYVLNGSTGGYVDVYQSIFFYGPSILMKYVSCILDRACADLKVPQVIY